MTVTGGRLLVEALLAHGVDTVFAIPGVQLDWAVDALAEERDRIRMIVPCNEQSVSMMADGYARSSGRVGVCMAVPGPGLLHAMAGLATAFACCSRVLMIAGQIDSRQIGRRQGMLHEIDDQSSVLAAVTGWHVLVHAPGDIPGAIARAFAELQSGIARPVCVEIPPDVLAAILPETGGPQARAVRPAPVAPIAAPADEDLAQLVARLQQARTPMIVAGRGVARSPEARAALRRLAETLDAPVLMSEGGRGALPDSHPLALPTAAIASTLPLADAVLGLGTRFLGPPGTSRQMAQEAWLGLVNLEPAHLGPPRPVDFALCADAGAVAEALATRLAPRQAGPGQALSRRARDSLAARLATIRPQNDWLCALRAAMPQGATLVTDLTQTGYLANVCFPVESPGELIGPGYQGTLGCAFPTALGVAAGAQGRVVVSISGDGGFAYALQELATAARHDLAMIAIVFADGRYGNVERIQKREFGRSYGTELHNTDYAMLARAFGVDFALAGEPQDIAAILARWKVAPAPLLVVAPVGEMDSPWPAVIGRDVFALPPEPDAALTADAG
ncbi:MAG: hypothetical protein JJU40_15730 [Rhodobacteraceae bacterium]|nr:hypothetical protein [Paracoccaceae bacterium]